MRTISAATEEVLTSHLVYRDVLMRGVVNFNALARELKPEIEALTLERVSVSAIAIALRRLADELPETPSRIDQTYPVQNLAVRSGLVLKNFEASPTLMVVNKKLLQLSESRDSYLHFSQGTNGAAFVLSEELVPELDKLTVCEKLVSKRHNVSALSIRMASSVMNETGVFAPFFNALADRQIHISQVMSYFTEITFVIPDHDIDEALSAVKGLKERSV